MSKTMSLPKKLAICAMCIALAFLLNQVSLFRMPLGGSITPFSMLLIVLAGYWLGPIYGILAGMAMGLLNTATGAVIYAPHQYILDYILAPGALGLSGFFRKQKYGLHIGYIVGVLGRFLMVFLSGYLVFYIYAPEGQHRAIYSALYNITYIGPEMIVTLIIISLPAMRHAIDVVTKSVVPHDDYVLMTRYNKSSADPRARLVTGTIIGIFGGLAFVLSSYISRLEAFAITHYTTGYELFVEAPTRIPRMIERNTGHIVGLQTAGILLLAIGIALVFSVMLPKNNSSQDI